MSSAMTLPGKGIRRPKGPPLEADRRWSGRSERAERAADLLLRAVERIELARFLGKLGGDVEIVVLIRDFLLHRSDQNRLDQLMVEVAEKDRHILVALELVLFEETDELS